MWFINEMQRKMSTICVWTEEKRIFKQRKNIQQIENVHRIDDNNGNRAIALDGSYVLINSNILSHVKMLYERKIRVHLKWDPSENQYWIGVYKYPFPFRLGSLIRPEVTQKVLLRVMCSCTSSLFQVYQQCSCYTMPNRPYMLIDRWFICSRCAVTIKCMYFSAVGH